MLFKSLVHSSIPLESRFSDFIQKQVTPDDSAETSDESEVCTEPWNGVDKEGRGIFGTKSGSPPTITYASTLCRPEREIISSTTKVEWTILM